MHNSKKEKRLNILEIGVAISLFFTTEVYLKWHSNMWTALGYIILLVLVAFLISGKLKPKSNDMLYASLFAIIFIWSKGVGGSLAGTIITFLIPFTLLIPWHKREQYLDFFITTVFPFFIGLSVVFYVLFILGYEYLPSFPVESLNELKPYDYISHIFFVMPDSILESMRFCSYYDEPGVVGTLMGAIIFFYHKKLNIVSLSIYIIAGLLSLSLLFFIAIFFWLLFASQWKIQNKVLAIIATAVLGVVVLSALGNIFDTDVIFERFSLKDGGLASNTRNTGDFSDFFYGRFIHTSEFWTGYTGNPDIAGGSSSFEKTIFLKGFLYLVFSVTVYLLFFLKYKVSNYQFLIYFGFWFALNYQRPSFDVLFFYLFFTTVIMSNYYTNKKELKVNRQNIKMIQAQV